MTGKCCECNASVLYIGFFYLFITTIIWTNLSCKVKKVKCTPVQTPRLCTGRTSHRGSTGIALLFLDHDTRKGWGVSLTPWPLYPLERPGTHCTRGWMGLRTRLHRCENLANAWIRSPDRPTRSHSLYRLGYRADNLSCMFIYIYIFFCLSAFLCRSLSPPNH